VYAPPSGGATLERLGAERALEAAARARGASVVANAVAQARRPTAWIAKSRLDFFGRAAKLVSDGREALARVQLVDAEARLAEAERVYAPELWLPGAAAEAATAA